MTDAIDNAIDDMLLARAAGTGPQFDDTEYLYPPVTQFAPVTGAMPTITELLNRMHAAEARNVILEGERDMLAGLVKTLLINPAYPGTSGWSYFECMYCMAGYRDYGNTAEALEAIDMHAADCPWRLAKEYLERAEP
jgi:hypothetical protein